MDNQLLLTIRLIKSFEFKNYRQILIRIDERNTISQLLQKVHDQVEATPNLKLLRNVNLDTVKIFTKPHGSKVDIIAILKID